MDKNHRKCLNRQIRLIEDISNIINIQISDIDSIGRSVVLPDATEDLKQAGILNTKRRYLEFFNDIVIFLIYRLKKEKEGNFRFLLPNIRTLLDIYGQLLYLCNEDENRQASICAANSLFTLANTVEKPDENSSEEVKQAYEKIKEVYDKGYNDWKPFFDREAIDVPENIELFSKGKLRELGLNFPPLPQMLKKENIRNCSPETIKVFPRAVKNISNTYRFLCNYVHGNTLSKGVHGNEKLWIIAKVQILSSLIVDLVNIKILGGSRKKELIKWMNELSQKRQEFVNFWRERNRNV